MPRQQSRSDCGRPAMLKLDNCTTGGAALRRRTPTQSLASNATEQIRRRIVDGDLKLGQALSETTLAAELGISKTPIREALVRLHAEGLVQILPQRGTFVILLSEVDAHALSNFRTMMEIEALRIAMRDHAPALVAALKAILAKMKPSRSQGDSLQYRALDDRFHRAIIEHGNNAYLAAAYENIAVLVQMLRNRLIIDVRTHGQSLKDHKVLVRLLEKGDVEKAAILLKEHIAKTPADYARRLTRSRDPQRLIDGFAFAPGLFR
ncbi:MAG: GntR family transcriptional regulator [Hyphomicrobiaceae bacterium]